MSSQSQPTDTSDGAMRTQDVLSVGQKFRRATDAKISFSKNNSKTSGGSNETPSPTSGPRFTNTWKEVSNGFELVFAADAEPECSLSITPRGLMSNQKEYPSTYIAISGVPNFRPTDMPARILPLLVYYFGILISLIEYFDRDLRPKLFMKDITGWWKHSNADISNWKESGNQVNIVQRWVGCRCISSCPSSVDYDNSITLFSEGGLKLSIGNWNCGIWPLHYYRAYYTRDWCPEFNPISASAEFSLSVTSFGVQIALFAASKTALSRHKYLDRDLRPKLFIIDRCVSQSHVATGILLSPWDDRGWHFAFSRHYENDIRGKYPNLLWPFRITRPWLGT